ncbi:hypothetical protein VHUM_00648 [Vanrija humicola]|uniref:3-hydroxy-3-methylglutaryl coenzyme A reductase n=1 Tax=Vanrija humicola TaxID=5417 RepID=A0A7D8V8H2_VANHU|nr:hypothetical protein VHUM_00648 [Vanrija humicola]
MFRSTVRSVLLALSSLSASAPIEVVTATFIVVTLAYFQLLQAIKGSEIFSLPAPAPPARPVHYVRLAEGLAGAEAAGSAFAAPHASYAPLLNSGAGEWLPVHSADFRRAIEANALEGGYVWPKESGGNKKGKSAAIVLVKQLTVVREDKDTDDTARDAWRNWVLNDVGVTLNEKTYTYADLCFDCERSGQPQLENNPVNPNQAVLTLLLRAPAPDTPTLTYLAQLAKLPTFSAPDSNATLRVLPPSSTGPSWQLLPNMESTGLYNLAEAKANAEDEQNPAVRKVRWVGYALRSLVFRFYTLARNADSADVFVVLLGYLLMHVAFVRLFMNMRKLGSNFWLPFATLISSTFAFLIALLFAYLLNVTIDPIVLSEALPFLVLTVGFDKPFRLASAVFEHPDISPVAASPDVTPIDDVPDEGGLGLDLGLLHRELAPLERLQKLADGKGIRWVAPVAARQIVTDAVGSVGVGIVRDYALEIAVLAMGAASGIGGLREFCYLAALALAVDCVFLFTFYVAILSVMVEVHRIKLVRGNRRAKAALKRSASGADSSRNNSPAKTGSFFSKQAEEVPKVEGQSGDTVWRLKFFVLISFLVLHVLNLCTTLTEQTALKRHVSHSVPTPRVDSRTGNLSPILEALYNSQPPNTDMIVQILTPTHIVQTHDGRSASRIESIDNFMSEWSTLVGDPVLSKWIVVVLFISVLLNGYLLKGIASNSIGGQGPVAAAAQALVGVFEAVDQPRRRARSPSTLEKYRAQRSADARQHLPNGTAHKSRASNGAANGVANGVANGTTNGAANGANSIPIHVTPPAAQVVPVIAKPVLDKRNSPPSSSQSQLAFGGNSRRSLEECIEVFAGGVGVTNLSDEEVILLVQKGKIAPYSLEKTLKDNDRAVRVRRAVVSRASLTQTLESSLLPMNDYDYQQIIGACCENVIGYMPIPVGVAGPLNIDGQLLHIPMATTEGTLVASASRGCKALNAGGGVSTVLTQDAMTRGPAIDFPSVKMAADAKVWIDSEDGFQTLSAAFNSTSRFARLQHFKTALAGRTLYVRFATSTGDAMGMNMISKGTEKALEVLQHRYPEMDVLALSGNYCTDKKPAAINWIEGRGKSVVAEGIVPGHIVKTVLKTTVKELCNLNMKKNLIGSAMAGSIGGFNAHSANILTAIYLACGQDPAQNVESSMCMTLMEPINDGEDLLITCSMPSIEVGTVGGGTILSPQRAMLEMLGIAGAHPTSPGANSQRLARIIVAAVMAGELSLMSALAAGHLIQAHMKHNRSVPATPGAMTPFGGMTPALREQSLIQNHLGLSPKIRLSPTKLVQSHQPPQ